MLRFQTSYNNCIKEAGTPQQLNTNYSGPTNLCALKIIIGWYCGLVKRFQKWIQVSILLSFWCHRYWSNGRIERLKKVMVRLSCFAHNKARVREGLWLRSRSKKYICDRIKDLFVFTIMTSQRLSWCWAYSYDGLGAHEIVFKLGYVVNVERWGRFLYIVKLRSKSAFILLISILVVKNIEFTDLELCIIVFLVSFFNQKGWNAP